MTTYLFWTLRIVMAQKGVKPISPVKCPRKFKLPIQCPTKHSVKVEYISLLEVGECKSI